MSRSAGTGGEWEKVCEKGMDELMKVEMGWDGCSSHLLTHSLCVVLGWVALWSSSGRGGRPGGGDGGGRRGSSRTVDCVASICDHHHNHHPVTTHHTCISTGGGRRTESTMDLTVSHPYLVVAVVVSQLS